MKTTETPVLQEFNLKGVKHILPEDAWQEMKNDQVIMVDIRDSYEVYAKHIEKVVYYPMGDLIFLVDKLPKEVKYIFVCEKGIRSTHIASYFTNKGFRHVASLDGGIAAWNDKKLPLVRFRHPPKESPSGKLLS